VEFVDLRQTEVQKEIVQHSPAALTVIMGLKRVGINMPPLAGGIRTRKRETERQGPLLLRLSCSYFTSHTKGFAVRHDYWLIGAGRLA
jgi:hypothetical protein